MKRPVIVILCTIIYLVFLILGVFSLTVLSLFSVGREVLANEFNSISLGVIIVGWILGLTFFYHFFMLKKSAIIWLLISFGWNLIFNIIDLSIGGIIFNLIIGGLLFYYIKTAKVNKRSVFN